MTTPPTDVDAVVLTWRDTERTDQCLRALLATPVRRIWLVDNQSTGGVRYLAALDERVTVIEEPLNRGFAGGVNRGLRESLTTDAPYVLCINNDARIDTRALATLAQALDADTRLGAVAPNLVVHGRTAAVPTFSPARMKVERTDDMAHVAFLTWACVLLRKDALREIGLLDEAFFMYWEDVDFGRRLLASGRTMRVVTAAEARHAQSSSHAEAGPLIALYSAHGLVVQARKIGGRALAAALLRVAARLARALLRGDLVRARRIAEGASLALRGDLTRPAHLTMARLSDEATS